MKKRKFVELLAAVMILAGCSSKQATDTSAISTESVQQGDLSTSIITLGTIASSDQVDIASSINMPVSEVHVQVGDTVSQGQRLATLDCSTLQSDYALKSKAYFQAQEIYQNNLDNATIAWQRAVDKRNVDLQAAKDAMEEARISCANSVAGGDPTALYNAWQTAITTTAVKENEKNTAAAAVSSLDAQCTATYGGSCTVSTLCSTAPDPAACNALVAQYNTAVVTQTNTQSAYDSAVISQQDAADAYSVANGRYSAAYNAVTAQNCNAYDSASRSYASLDTSSAENIADLYNARWRVERDSTSVDSARIAYETASKQLQQCVVVAPIGGVIVASKAAVNGIPASSDALFSIANSSDYVISGLVNEYDSTRISVGMDCEITSDALGDGVVLTGTVKTISPQATDTSGDFSVTVAIDGQQDVIKSGMTGKIKILLEQSKNCFYVSGDAISVDDNGNSVIYVQQADGSFSPMTVQTGLETDYYVEITGTGLSTDMVVASEAYLVEGN